MTPNVFYQRLLICRQCEFWKNVCLKGHPLQNPVGCPVKKFPPIDNAGYFPDTPVPQASNEPAPPCAGCGAAKDPDVVPLTWAEAIRSFQDSMKRAQEQGWPLVSDKVYSDRQSLCRSCQHYRFFQCRYCKCVIWFKAKLATETCPLKLWPA